ncbi:unnamed protein product [Urochloa humidicola]
MTTADTVGHRVEDEQLDIANAYKMGAGHINVSRAMDPGLVYDRNEQQYAAHVCSTLGEVALRAVSRNDSWRCSELPTRPRHAPVQHSNLNYPSIITAPLQPAGFYVVRMLTNVAPPEMLQARTQSIRSPMLAVVSLATSQPSTAWKLD